ncbi:MAG: thioredoxin-disulfide reductase [Victivallales bacterium]
MENVVIIGSGAAGLTAAVYSSRADLEPLVIAGQMPGGLLTQTSDVENYPGFPEAVNGYELMFKFQQQAENFGTRIKNDTVSKVELKNGGPHKIQLASGETIETRTLIIATGAAPRWLGLESEDRLKNKGVSACATCDGAFFRNVPVLVVGGGDTAMEEALFLTKFASKVTVVHRRDELRASKIMADRAMNNPKIEFMWSSQVVEIIGDSEVEKVRVKNLKDNSETIVEAKGYFAALGHVPNTEVFKGAVETDDKGFIKLKDGSGYTSVDGVFAAGDCADHVYRQAITAAGMGCRAAIDAERWLESQHR